MSEAKNGDTVRVHFTGKLRDGTVFDSSKQSDPIEFKIGSGQIITGFEEAVVGMQAGESKAAHVPAEKAYGPHLDDMVQTMPREKLPADIEPEVGQKLQARYGDGEVTRIVVTEVSDDSVTLDANHPLAGQDLLFEIELVEIV